MGKKNERIAGLIVYGEDDDTLAGELGKRMAQDTPTGYRVIEYGGPKDYPGERKYTIGDDPTLLASERALQTDWLRDIDYAYFKKLVKPHMRRQIHGLAYAPGFPTFILHSTNFRHTKRHIIQFAPASRRSSISQFLQTYVADYVKRNGVNSAIVLEIDPLPPVRGGPQRSVEIEILWPGLDLDESVRVVDGPLRVMFERYCLERSTVRPKVVQRLPTAASFCH